MITDEFKVAYKSLNTKQKEAVDAIEGPVMVIAGPGTGKTQILTLRIANILLKTQVNPENILALTFSEAASFQMRERLSKVIGSPAYSVEISTFHSFANNIIKDNPDEFQQLLSSESITEVEQIEVLEKLIETLDLKILRPYGDPLYYLKEILSAINNLKKEGITSEDLRIAIQKQIKDFENIDDLVHEKGKYSGEMKIKYKDLEKDIEKEKELQVVFENYQKQLVEKKMYDFNDMLGSVVLAFSSNKSLLLRIQEKYQYILVDEHQDTNATQNKLIELVSGFFEIPNLFVVGDEKQAIYRFQGASIENFLYFKNLYPKVKIITLEKNYRSHQLILDAAGSLIEKNVSANILPQAKLTTALKLEKENIKSVELSNYQMEYEFVARDIADKISKGQEISEIAVLARRNKDLVPLTSSLSRMGIKYIIQADQDILKDLNIKKLLMIFEAIASPLNEIYFANALQIDFLKIDSFDVYKILGYSRKEKINIFDIFSKLDKKLEMELGLENPKALQAFFVKYKNWIQKNGNIPLDDLFSIVATESGLINFILKNPDSYQALNKLNGLLVQIKQHLEKNPDFTLEEFLKYLETIKKHQIGITAVGSNSQEEGVRLMTVHKSKGLEFEYVYIINFFDTRWGNSRKRGAKIKIPWLYLGKNIKADVEFEEIEDERRLFFVALTRAKKGITLTFSKQSLEGKEQLRSQFFGEINGEFMENLEPTAFEKDFDQSILFNTPIQSKINIKNQEYLNKLFLEKGLSPTALDDFLKCPWRYFFKDLISLPQEKNKNLIFGSAVHNALDKFLKTRNIKKIDEKFLIKTFKELIEKESLTSQDRKDLLEKGQKALEAFYKTKIPTWPKDIQSEFRIKGINFYGDVFLNGRIDMIEPLPGGKFRIHDFKTGKIKSRSSIDGSKENSDYNYKRQLVFYKILLDSYKSGLFKVSEGVIDFVEPDEKGNIKSEVFEIRQEDVSELKNLIKFVAKQITELNFWDLRCGDPNCDYCLLRGMSF